MTHYLCSHCVYGHTWPFLHHCDYRAMSVPVPPGRDSLFGYALCGDPPDSRCRTLEPRSLKWLPREPGGEPGGGWVGGWMQRALGGRFSVRTLTAAFDLAPTRLHRNISSPLVTPHCLFKMTWIYTAQT